MLGAIVQYRMLRQWWDWNSECCPLSALFMSRSLRLPSLGHPFIDASLVSPEIMVCMILMFVWSFGPCTLPSSRGFFGGIGCKPWGATKGRAPKAVLPRPVRWTHHGSAQAGPRLTYSKASFGKAFVFGCGCGIAVAVTAAVIVAVVAPAVCLLFASTFLYEVRAAVDPEITISVESLSPSLSALVTQAEERCFRNSRWIKLRLFAVLRATVLLVQVGLRVPSRRGITIIRSVVSGIRLRSSWCLGPWRPACKNFAKGSLATCGTTAVRNLEPLSLLEAPLTKQAHGDCPWMAVIRVHIWWFRLQTGPFILFPHSGSSNSPSSASRGHQSGFGEALAAGCGASIFTNIVVPYSSSSYSIRLK